MMKFANPARFQALSETLEPWLWGGAALLLGGGLYLGLAASPADYQQGDTVRIMYVHVPAAWIGLCAYGGIALASAVGLIWKHPLAHLFARAAAPVGAAFTLLCLITGALWGKPMWGAWWVWDARLTSMLILLFLYMGHMALSEAFDDPQRGQNSAAVLALVGSLNLPVIKFSVDWWNTLHQPSSLVKASGPAIDPSMLAPLLLMAGGSMVLFAVLVLVRMRVLLLQAKIRAVRFHQVQASASR